MEEHEVLNFELIGIPKPHQSVKGRVRYNPITHKNYVQTYQPQDVVNMQKSLAWQIVQQIPSGFVPTKNPVMIRVQFVFPPLKTWPKWKERMFEEGITFYKPTKPDLQDNLMKNLADSMEGIIYQNDSQIISVFSEKVYGRVPKTVVSIKIIEEPTKLNINEQKTT